MPASLASLTAELDNRTPHASPLPSAATAKTFFPKSYASKLAAAPASTVMVFSPTAAPLSS